MNQGVRPYTLRPCSTKGCASKVMTAGTWKRCEVCIAELHALEPQKRRYTPRKEWLDDSEAVIEANFQAALVAIKRRPRTDPELRWTSPLAGLNGSGL